jgi:hypothetical protein
MKTVQKMFQFSLSSPNVSRFVANIEDEWRTKNYSFDWLAEKTKVITELVVAEYEEEYSCPESFYENSELALAQLLRRHFFSSLRDVDHDPIYPDFMEFYYSIKNVNNQDFFSWLYWERVRRLFVMDYVPTLSITGYEREELPYWKPSDVQLEINLYGFSLEYELKPDAKDRIESMHDTIKLWDEKYFNPIPGWFHQFR